MLIRIDHTTTYSYQQAPRSIIQVLRLTPRPHEGQHIKRWDIELDVDARMRKGEDAFGNITHTLYVDAPTQSLSIRVKGEVMTTDTAGTLNVSPERLSPLVYLRSTPLTEPDAAIQALARKLNDGSPLERAHRLSSHLYRDLSFQIGTTTTAHTAAEVLQQKSGVCQDYAHLFIATARAMGIPARYVSGHLYREDGQTSQDAAHAWTEAWIEDLGWVGFDPANGVCPTEAYVRIAAGLDYLGAAPVRGSSYGGGHEDLQVRVEVYDARNPPPPRPQQQTQQ